jgi:hypothetical protein
VLSWTVPGLAAGASATLSIPMQVASSGVPAGLTQLDNRPPPAMPHCTGSPLPAGCAATRHRLHQRQPERQHQQSAAPATVLPGGLVSYTLTVSNTGSSAPQGWSSAIRFRRI